jgi:hypothetical protein
MNSFEFDLSSEDLKALGKMDIWKSQI